MCERYDWLSHYCLVIMLRVWRSRWPGPAGDKSPAWCWPGSGRDWRQTREGEGDWYAGGEERRVRSERRGPDIQRPLDVRDPVCQSAGNGETHEHRRRHIPVCPCARRVARMRRERDIWKCCIHYNVLRLRVCGNCTVADNCQPIFLPFTLSTHLNRPYNRTFCQKKSMFNTNTWGRWWHLTTDSFICILECTF